MFPATAVPAHSLNTLDRIAFYKSVREKRKQLQLNHQGNAGKESRSSSMENTFLTQMLQSSSSASSSVLSHGNVSSFSSPSHRTLTNILPALLNGTMPSTTEGSTNVLSLISPSSTNTTDTLVETKCSTSLPVSPAANISKNYHCQISAPPTSASQSSSPPRCRSYPTAASNERVSPPTSTSCPSLAITTTIVSNAMISSTSPSPDEIAPKLVRSASVKSCASDSGVSSSSPLSDNNIVHVFRSNHLETIHQSSSGNGSRKRKSLAYFYEELNKDKKFSTEATVSSAFPMPTSNANIPYSQQEAIAIGYAQYALMQSLTQQLRVNYPAAFLHAAAAAAATGFMPLPAKITPGTASNNTNANEKNRERRKPVPESDNNNNHIRVTPFSNQEQPYRRETYQTLLESSQLLGQHKLPRPVPIDLRKQEANNRPVNHSPIPSSVRYTSSSSSSTSPTGSPPCQSPRKSSPIEPVNEYVCIPKKLMPVIGARINDWLERNLNFVSSLSVINETLSNDRDKLFLLSHVWHRLVLISMIENSFEIYVTKDLQIASDVPSSVSQTHPTENDVKQIESLISRGKTLDIDEIGFNLIREVIIYKEGKTLLASSMAEAFDKAECHAQARLTSWCSSRVKYSKIVFFLCNTYQVKQDIFERLFCASSLHQSTPIQTYIERFLNSSATSMDDA